MKELLLDAETLYTREQLHDVLTKVCGFPADYGRNLDALYDLSHRSPSELSSVPSKSKMAVVIFIHIRPFLVRENRIPHHRIP